MKVESMEALYLFQLRDLYSAEKQLIRALEKLSKSAGNAELKQALTSHLEETRGHAETLERIFASLEQSPGRQRCRGIAGIIEEGDSLAKQATDENVRDAAIIGAAQHTEHYEMAGYGTALEHAGLLGRTEDVRLLQQTSRSSPASWSILRLLPPTRPKRTPTSKTP
jgi:ferritin-like metal-binding protein YciE